MRTFLLLIRELLHGCWLHHDWQLLKDDGQVIEQRCGKCGKRVSRRG